MWPPFYFIWAAKISLEQMVWGRQTRRWFPSGCIFNSSHACNAQLCSPSEDRRGICRTSPGSGWACPSLWITSRAFFFFYTNLLHFTNYLKRNMFEESLADQSFTPAQSWTRVNNICQDKGPKYKEAKCVTCWFCLSVFSVCYEWCILSNSCALCIVETTAYILCKY